MLDKYVGKKVKVQRFATDIAKNPMFKMDFTDAIYSTTGEMTAANDTFIELDGNLLINLKWVYSITWVE
ncbi:MAG: hypothetical protein LBM09_02490 [Candidatus Nomurabacteria bacterium]|jgi:hypothetical protein|nr:hypothetical protein [Candidatus Nomurabacteria bacterium]